jgi:ankyrin repeat protein
MHHAAQKGNEARIRKLLETSEVDTFDMSNKTPLMHACANGRLGCAKLLISSKSDVNKGDPETGKTPLYYAVSGAHLSVADALIEAKADVNDCVNGESLLTAASRAPKSHMIVASLIAAGADANAVLPRGGLPPLLAAACSGCAKSVKLLLDAGANVDATDAEGRTAIFASMLTGNTTIFNMLLEAKASLHTAYKGMPILVSACSNNRFQIAKKLIAAGADPNDRGTTGTSPLNCCIKARNFEILHDLVNAGADIHESTAEIPSPFHEAANSGFNEALKIFIEAGANLNARTSKSGGTPLTHAVAKNKIKSAELLIAAGADVNAVTHTNLSSLMAAAIVGSVPLANLLISANVDMNLRDVNGETAVAHAIAKRQLPVLRALITANADVDIPCTFNYTPVFSASRDGFLEAVRVLVAANADPSIRAEDSSTPLIVAAQNGHLGVVKALIFAKADVNQRVTFDTPLTVAMNNGHNDIAKALKAAGAKL